WRRPVRVEGKVVRRGGGVAARGTRAAGGSRIRRSCGARVRQLDIRRLRPPATSCAGTRSAMPSVKERLASLGLSEYADRFAEHRIDFSILRDLTDEDLKEELGVVLLGDRRRLLRAIAQLAGARYATPQRAHGAESRPRH